MGKNEFLYCLSSGETSEFVNKDCLYKSHAQDQGGRGPGHSGPEYRQIVRKRRKVKVSKFKILFDRFDSAILGVLKTVSFISLGFLNNMFCTFKTS